MENGRGCIGARLVTRSVPQTVIPMREAEGPVDSAKGKGPREVRSLLPARTWNNLPAIRSETSSLCQINGTGRQSEVGEVVREKVTAPSGSAAGGEDQTLR